MRIGVCEFLKPVNFKNGYIAEVILPLSKTPMVQITDVAKDNWQLPILGTHDVGNPKLKTMSIEDFQRTFKITHQRWQR